MKLRFTLLTILFLLLGCDLFAQVIDAPLPDKLDSLVLESAISMRKEMNILNKEQARSKSEELLTYAANNTKAGSERTTEDAFISLVAAKTAQIIKQDFKLTHDIEYAVNLEDLAIYYEEFGQFNKGLYYNYQAFQIISGVSSEEGYIPDVLQRVAFSYDKLEDYDSAASFMERAAKEYKQIDDTESYGWSLYHLAKYKYFLGLYKESAILYDTVRNTVEFTVDDLIEYLRNAPLPLLFLGEYEKALVYTKALAMYTEQQYGVDSYEHSKSLSNLGTSYMMLNRAEQADSCFQKAIGIIESDRSHNYDNAITYDQYAKFLIGNYDYVKAYKFASRARGLFEQCVEGDSYDYTEALLTLSDCESHIGQKDAALKHAVLAMDVREKIAGRRSGGYTNALNDVVGLLISMGNYEEAYDKALLLEKLLMEMEGESRSVAVNSSNIASIKESIGSYAESEDYTRKALEIYERMGDSEGVQSCYWDLGDIAFSQGQYVQALAQYEKSGRQITHIEIGDVSSFYRYAVCQINVADYSGALETIKRINGALSSYVKQGMIGMTSAERRSFWNRYSTWYDNALPYLIFQIPLEDASTELYNSRLLYKGFLLEADRSFVSKALTSGDEHVTRLMNDLLLARRQLKAKTVSSPEASQESRESILKRIDEYERAILESDYTYRDLYSRLFVDWAEIKTALKPNEIAIEFSTDGKDYYALIVTNKSTHPELVHLFTIDEIPAVPSIRGGYPSKKELLEYESFYNKIYDVIWRPIENRISGCQDVFFSPEGVLNSIGIEYAQGLPKKCRFHRLASTRDIVNGVDQKKTYDSAVLFGGLDMNDFDINVSSESSSGGSSPMLRGSASSSSFSDISMSTKKEVDAIAEQLKSKGKSTYIVSGKQGTEDMFRQQIEQGYNIVHVATHGFFWNKESASKISVQWRGGMEETEYDPMEFSGLAMSGANKMLTTIKAENAETSFDFDDELLTASEVSMLDMNNVELVSLSACETGLGLISGDGVFGLQRGFRLAGVKKILMSLWKVDTDATALLMQTFYKSLSSGRSPEVSLRDAQDALRKKEEYNNPYYWGAFILLE